MKKTISFVAIAMLFAIGVAFGQSSTEKSATLIDVSTVKIDMGEYESMVIAHDSADNRFVSGDGLGVKLVKYSPAGELLWKNTWDASDTAESIQHQMVYDHVDNSVIVATLQEFGTHPELVAKFDGNDGHQIWQIEMRVIALAIWRDYILALGSSGISFVRNSDGSTESNFPMPFNYYSGYPTIQVSGDTLCYFDNARTARFLLPSGRLLAESPTTDFAANAIRTYGIVDTKGNSYGFASDAWDREFGRILFAAVKHSGNGPKFWSYEWYGSPDTSLAGGASRSNLNNGANGLAVDESLGVLAVFGGTQKAGTAGYQVDAQSAYLALLNADSGDTLVTATWDDEPSASVTNWYDGYFNSKDQLVLLGYCYGNTLDNFIEVFDLNIIDAVKDHPVQPNSFALSQNYPNPFNPTTTIRYGISQRGFVTLKVYDVLGREVKTLVQSDMNPGVHEISFDGSSLPSGTYFYRLTTSSGQTETKKMVLLK